MSDRNIPTDERTLNVFCEACHVCGQFTCVTVDTDGVDQLRVGLELIACLRRGDFVSMESVLVARENFGCTCNKTALRDSQS